MLEYRLNHHPHLWMAAILFIAALLMPVESRAASDADDAAQAVRAFYQSFYAGKWSEASSAFHPETQAMLHGLFVHIAESSASKEELREFLSTFGVRSTAEFKKMEPGLFITKLFQGMWSGLPEDTRKWWKAARFSLVGTVKEGELYHIVFRTAGSMEAQKLATVSVASAKRYKGKWKMLSSAEIQGVMKKLER